VSITFTTLGTEPFIRNHNKWPMILPLEGEKRVPYMRVSKLAKYLGDTFALEQWAKRQVVLGLAEREDLVLLAQSATADDKQRLNDIAQQATDAARSNSKANIGTAVHSFTDRVDDGEDPDTLPLVVRPGLHAYRSALTAAGLEVVAKELAVCNDHVQAAGTFDRLFRCTRDAVVQIADRTVEIPAGTVAVGDLKTGQDDRFPHGAAQQIATYANSHLYHEDKGGRYGYLPDLGVSTDVGLMVHLPQDGSGCTIYVLDIALGWQMVKTAAAVKAAFKEKVITPYTP
jgi:hypothetical protein